MGLRITFDNNLRSRRDNFRLECDSDTDTYFSKDENIMEIKTLGSMPLWLVRILSEMKIVPISFSKYGKIYERENENVCKEILERLKRESENKKKIK